MRISNLRRNRPIAGLVATFLVTAGIVAGASAPASAAPAALAPAASSSSGVDYVALGDSYAAGQGGGRYLDPVCKRTRLGYPAVLDVPRSVRLTNATCSGATTGAVLAVQIPSVASKLAGAELVTLTVGGNDLNTGQIAAVCTGAPSSQACADLVAAVPAGLANVANGLGGILGTLDAAAPGAKIVVTGYPRLLAPVAPTDPNFQLITAVNLATDSLNDTLRSVVDGARSQGVNARFVDVTGLFAKHGVGSAFPWIKASGPDIFHPNAFGHAAYVYAVGRAAL